MITTMNKKGILFFILFTVLGGAVFAADDLCEKMLQEGPGKLSIVSSGRDGDVIGRYKEEFRIASEVAYRLGLNVPPHRAEIIPSGQLTVLANVGHYPMPHWHDGSKVLQAAKSGGVLEFVDPGCPTCRSFYQDTTPPEWQRSILFHVLGHNDVAVLSQFNFVRAPLDPMAVSLQLASLVTQLYERVDHDEVALWIQQLLTVTDMQDYVFGSFDAPQSWVRRSQASIPQVIERDILGQPIGNLNPYGPQVHPRKPTPNVLQFLVENLPPSAPQWKRDVLKLLEPVFRAYGSFSQQKILNEGWATFMQWFLPKYTPWRDSNDLVKYGDLLWGVAFPELSNPYWLGFEGWKCLYRRFLARDDIKALSSDEERDKAFVRYAHPIIASDSDFDFIHRAFDAQWVFEQKLHLKREAGWGEYDYNLPGRKPEHNTQAIITSRDPKKIIAWIAKNVADHSLHWARVQIVNENGMGRGIAVYEHHVFEDIPLELKSAAKTLFVLSQVHEKPVSLKTVGSSSWLPAPPPPWGDDDFWAFVRVAQKIPAKNWDDALRAKWEDFLKTKIKDLPSEIQTEIQARMKSPAIRYAGPGFVPPWFPWPQAELKIFPIRIEVTPEGKVQVFEIKTGVDGKTEEVLQPDLTEKAQDAVTEQKFDLRSSGNDDLAKRENKRFSPQIISQIVDVALDPARGILHHGPGSAEAVLEYTRMVKERLARALEKALKGEIPVVRSKNGVRIRVLPNIPSFRLDRKVAKLLREKLPPAPLDPTMTLRVEVGNTPTGPLGKDNSGIGQGDGDTGDKKWDKKDEDDDGDGDGDGDGDPDDGWGDGASDPRDVEIPLDIWAKLLSEELELPNTRELAGKSTQVETYRVGSKRHPRGNILWDRTIPAALFHSMMERLSKGEPPIENVGPQLVEGSRYLTPDDYVVSSTATNPLPNIKAVVTVVADMSGSMGGLPQMLEAEFIWYLRLLLKAKYKEVVFRFVGFDTEAREFSEEEIFRKTLGGGTAYASGYKLGGKILDEYPDSQWDKYFVGMGDCETGDVEETMALTREIYPRTRYMTFAYVKAYGLWGGQMDPLAQAAEEFSRQNEWFGFANLTGEPGSVMSALRKLFGKDRKQQQ